MDLLSLRLVGAVGARINARKLYPQWAPSMTRTGTRDLPILRQALYPLSYQGYGQFQYQGYG